MNQPLPLEHIPDADEPRTRDASTVEANAEMNEMLRLIDRKLDVDLRATYLQMRAGKAVPKALRHAVERAVREILGDALEQQVA